MKPTFSSHLSADLFALGASFRPTKEDYEEALAGVPMGLSPEDVDRMGELEDGRIHNIRIAPPDYIYREALVKAQRKIGFHAPTIGEGEF